MTEGMGCHYMPRVISYRGHKNQPVRRFWIGISMCFLECITQVLQNFQGEHGFRKISKTIVFHYRHNAELNLYVFWILI